MDVVRVVLCTITYRRPVSLAWSLDATMQLAVPPGVQLRVVVVDNDVEETAREIVESRNRAGARIEYVVEPTRGIAFARNRGVATIDDADLLGFVDDDEALLPRWLETALRAWRAADADVVIGSSEPWFVDGAPSWVIEGQFFERQRFTTGDVVSPGFARTSGVLIAARALPPPPAFDTRYPLSGGSDTHLFQQLAASGRRIVWCDEARVVERVPSSRASTRWLVMRRYRIANTRSLRTLPSGWTGVYRRARRVTAGALDIIAGLAALVASVRHGRVERVRALQRMAYGAGLVTGALGIAYREYRVVHGR